MIKYAVALLFSVSMLNAQTNTKQTVNDVKIGDVFEIGSPETYTYSHINFPRANFIIKRGDIANYKKAEGEKVVITSVEKNSDGTTLINIERVDGKYFFRGYKAVSVNLKEAIESGELELL